MFNTSLHASADHEDAFIYIEACTKVHVYIHVHDVQKIGPSATSPYSIYQHTHIKLQSLPLFACTDTLEYSTLVNQTYSWRGGNTSGSSHETRSTPNSRQLENSK